LTTPILSGSCPLYGSRSGGGKPWHKFRFARRSLPELELVHDDGRFWLSSDNAGLLLTPETEAKTPTASIFHQANLLCPGRRLTPYALSQATQLLWFLLNFCHSHPQRQSAKGPRLGHYALVRLFAPTSFGGLLLLRGCLVYQSIGFLTADWQSGERLWLWWLDGHDGSFRVY